ncbi:MAG: hypothetical protein JWM27_2278 [Gemmatimonadetes bacterium]|nr:hypothetical protein [Gemmatimonadota bacterium]
MTRFLRGSLLALGLLGAEAPVLTATPLVVEGRLVNAVPLPTRADTTRRDASRLPVGTFIYGITFNGNAVGATTSIIARDGQGWIAIDSLPGVSSEWRFTNDFAPLTVRQAAPAAGLDVQLIYSPGHVRGPARLPAQMGGDKTIDAAIPAGTIASGMETLVVMTADLAQGRRITLPSFSATTNAVANVTAEVVGSESVTVPAGTFDTWKVQVTGGETPYTLWVRKDAPHVAVKQALAGQPVVIELQSIR